MDSGPGFSTMAFALLEQKVEEARKNGKQLLVAMMLDDMAIRRQLEFDQKKSQLIGYIDVGSGKGPSGVTYSRGLFKIW